MSYKLCDICKCTLDRFADSATKNCGGTCLRCMAECGDPDCAIAMEKYGLPFDRKWWEASGWDAASWAEAASDWNAYLYKP